MRPGLRILNSACLMVSMTNAVPANMRENVRELIAFTVDREDRRKKLGTLLLNLVCQEADANKITLILTAAPPPELVGVEGQMSEEQLVAWYTRFGFTMLQQTSTGTMMARRIHAPDRTRLRLGDNAVSRAIAHG